MIELDFDSALKMQYPELGDNPIDTLEKEYMEIREFKKEKSDEFDAEHFELLKKLLFNLKIFPYVQNVLAKAITRETLGKEAKVADFIKIEPKHKVTSSKMYAFLKSLDEDSIRTIIGGVTDNQEEYDALSDAIESDDRDLFITIVHKYNNLKLHNICALKIAYQNDITAINRMMVSDQISSPVDNEEDLDSKIEDYMEENVSFYNDVSEMVPNLDNKDIIQVLLQIADLVISVRERKQMKQFFKDPVVNSIFDGGKYISDSRPNATIAELIKDNPMAAIIMAHRFNLDISELLGEHSKNTREISTSSEFRSMLIGSDEKKNEIIAKLKKHIDEKGEVVGMDLAQLVFAASEVGWLVKPDNIKDFHKVMVSTFGNKLGVQESLGKNIRWVLKIAFSLQNLGQEPVIS